MPKAINLTGQKYNFLTCLEPSAERAGPSIVWKCMCDCGQICYKPADAIRDGRNKSCGCHKYKSKYGSFFWKIYCRYRDDRRGFSFNLTEDEAHLLIYGDCHYCGASPKITRYHYNGIDRISSEFGYSVGNCVSCCWICNRAKSDMSYVQFRGYLARIVARYREDCTCL